MPHVLVWGIEIVPASVPLQGTADCVSGINKGRYAMTEIDERKIQKHDAFQFLKGLEKHLNSTLPSWQQMRKEVRDLVTNARRDNFPTHLKNPESAFTNHFLIPRIFDIVSERVGKDKSQQCMLSEYKAMRKVYCGKTSPQRQERHPFSKGMTDTPRTIMRRWKGEPNKRTVQSAPDLALRDPFPFNIVFEIKYFDKGGAEKATTELVSDLYQAFFLSRSSVRSAHGTLSKLGLQLCLSTRV